MGPSAEQWLLPDPGLLPLHVSPRLSSADVTAGLLVPPDSPLGSVGGSRALPSSAGGSAGNGAGSFFGQSLQLPDRGGGGMQHDDVAHMLTEPSGIGGQARTQTLWSPCPRVPPLVRKLVASSLS